MTLWQRLVGRRPIVTRLVLAVVAAMAVVLLTGAALVYWRVSYALDRQLDQDLNAWAVVVSRSVSSTLPTTQPSVAGTSGETFQVYDARGRLLSGDRSLPWRVDPRDASLVAGGGRLSVDVGRLLPVSSHPYRIQLRRVESPSGARVVAAVISRRKHDEALRELLLQLGIADLVALLAAAFVGYRTARAALDPVESYRVAAARASVEEVGRLPVAEDRDDELSRLGHTFNDLLGRIEAAAARERQFLADASHELRTPLALMSTELEWARHRPRSAEELAPVLSSLQAQVQRLVGLSDALLELEELRAGGPLTREAVSLREVVDEAVLHGLPPGHPVRVEVPDVVVEVNRRWLDIALSNLLGNAARHGRGETCVQASYDEPWLRLRVSDEGPGFPAEFRAVAFDRFSRGEASRTTPGSGLGLYLVSSVALAHGGTARILDGPGAVVELVVRGRAEGRAEGQVAKS